MVSVLILLILNYFNRGTIMMINDRRELQSTILTYSLYDSVGVATLLKSIDHDG